MLFNLILVISSLVFLLVGYSLGVRDKKPLITKKIKKKEDVLMHNLEIYDGTNNGQKAI